MTNDPKALVMKRPEWLPRAEFPFDLRQLEVDGDTLTYIDEGAGPTLLFVHTGMWSFIFRDAIVRLREDFRCITLDFPGYGLSPDPIGDDLGLAEQSRLLGRFADALDLEDVTLVLHDLGGPVGMRFASRNPERIRGLVLANTFAWQPDDASLVRMLRLMSSRPMTAFDKATRLIPALTSTRFGAGRHLSRAGRRAFRGPFRDRLRIERFHWLLGDALDADALYESIQAAMASRLRELPALTIFGERNDPFSFQERHAANLATHRGIVVSKGNHFPMMDAPDLFADSIRDWHESVLSVGQGGKRHT